MNWPSAITGEDNACAIDCTKFLAERGKRVWVRRVLLPALTDGAYHNFVRTVISFSPCVLVCGVVSYSYEVEKA